MYICTRIVVCSIDLVAKIEVTIAIVALNSFLVCDTKFVTAVTQRKETEGSCHMISRLLALITSSVYHSTLPSYMGYTITLTTYTYTHSHTHTHTLTIYTHTDSPTYANVLGV